MPRREYPPVPREPRRDREPTTGTVLVYAGESSKRLLFLQHAFPNYTAMQMSGGYEDPQEEDVVRIARGKVNFAFHRNRELSRIISQNKDSFIIATDVRTNPLTKYSSDPEARTRSLRKPEREHDIVKTFRRIARARDPFYLVQAGTVLRKKGSDRATKEQMWARLDQQKMEHFGTLPGFAQYKQAFADFYSATKIYGEKEEDQPTLLNIAGGLSFGVLVRLGAVMEVDGAKKGTPEFRQAVKRGLYVALIGFDVDTLKGIRPDIEDVINNYPPLELATAIALGEKPLTPGQVQEGVAVVPRRPRRAT